jgi:hypothetical protein
VGPCQQTVVAVLVLLSGVVLEAQRAAAQAAELEEAKAKDERLAIVLSLLACQQRV